MNISSVSSVSNFQQAVTQQQIGTAVAVKVNDAAKAQGELVLNLLNGASENGADTDASGKDGDLDIKA